MSLHYYNNLGLSLISGAIGLGLHACKLPIAGFCFGVLGLYFSFMAIKENHRLQKERENANQK